MLETVAGVPGMIAGMARHFYSLRKLTRDHGWIHTLLGTQHRQVACEFAQIDKFIKCYLLFLHLIYIDVIS